MYLTISFTDEDVDMAVAGPDDLHSEELKN
jgi:hypothetical protein